VQEDFTEFIFSDLLRSILQQPSTSAGIDNANEQINWVDTQPSAGTDLSCPSDLTMIPTTDTINRSLRSGGDTSEAAQPSEHQLQQSASETVGTVEYEPQPIVPQCISQDPTDADLIEQAAVGNERAFELLVQRYETLVSGFVYYRLARTDYGSSRIFGEPVWPLLGKKREDP
jgi:hypothetical protein